MHYYDDFVSSLAVPAIEAARRLATSLKPCIAAFRIEIEAAAR